EAGLARPNLVVVPVPVVARPASMSAVAVAAVAALRVLRAPASMEIAEQRVSVAPEAVGAPVLEDQVALLLVTPAETVLTWGPLAPAGAAVEIAAQVTPVGEVPLEARPDHMAVVAEAVAVSTLTAPPSAWAVQAHLERS